MLGRGFPSRRQPPQGQRLVPPHTSPTLVTLRVDGEDSPFDDRRLASEVFAVTARHPATLAACLLPDRLLWLLRSGWDVAETVGRFKAYSNRLAKQAGLARRLWAHVYEETRARRGQDVGRLLVDEPRRCGLVVSSTDYPWQIRRHR